MLIPPYFNPGTRDIDITELIRYVRTVEYTFDEKPKKEVPCPDCKGTGNYVGIGFFPQSACKCCEGSGKILVDNTEDQD